MYTHTYETRYGDFKDFDTIKTGAVLDMVQDVSILDSNRCSYGINALRDMSLAWLLQGINVKIEKPVKTFMPIEVSTGVKTLKGVTSERGCIIKQNGEVVAKTIANWFLFNTEKMRIAKIPQDMHDKYEFYDFNDEFFTFVKPDLYDINEPLYTVKVSNKEIDTNMHLNNQKGADLLMDALPFDFSFNSIKILYKKPAYLNDMLGVCIKETEKGYYVHLMSQDNDVCVAGTFENI